MLITETYRGLNHELHRQDPTYGTSGQLYAEHVRVVADKIGSRDILDYGAGKCTLARALGWELHHYDPAIPEIAARPLPADLVVCTDVLEHIEPHAIDDVLDDLKRLTKDTVFLGVATGPAKKLLPDGRNTHLSQHPLTWWLLRLEKRFTTVRYWTTSNGFTYVGRAREKQFEPLDLSEIGPEVKTTNINIGSVYTDAQRAENIRSALLRDLPRVRQLPAHDRIATVACYGPSLMDTLGHIRLEKSDIWTNSGAHRVLLENGVKIMGHIEADPRPHKIEAMGKPKHGVAYMVASACSREMFQHLAQHEKFLFHVTSSPLETRLIATYEPDAFTIDAGTNVGIASIVLLHVLGYRKFSIHAMDCSFDADHELLHWDRDRALPETDLRGRIGCHAGKHPNEDQMIVRVWVGDRPFITSPQMLQGAQDFIATRNALRNCRFQIHGDGYLPNLLRHAYRVKQMGAA